MQPAKIVVDIYVSITGFHTGVGVPQDSPPPQKLALLHNKLIRLCSGSVLYNKAIGIGLDHISDLV